MKRRTVFYPSLTPYQISSYTTPHGNNKLHSDLNEALNTLKKAIGKIL
ncbi:hypothetical protein [Caldisphaera sp.]